MRRKQGAYTQPGGARSGGKAAGTLRGGRPAGVPSGTRCAPPELRMQTGSFFRIPPLLPRLASFGRLPQAAPKEAAFYTPPGGIYGFFRSDRCFFRCNRLFFGNPLLFCPDCATLLLVKLILSAYTSVTVLCRRIERGACNEEMVEWRSCAAPQEYR